MTTAWTFAVARDDLARTTVARHPAPVAGDGEAVLRVDRIGLTANNVTYAVLGDAFRYWQFFPPEPRGLDPHWGLPPVWGFADVVDSRVEGVAVGTRVYGYLPPATELVVRPGRVDARGFRDVSPHRAPLPSPYNVYAATTGDAAYAPDQEDLLVLYRPLFFTSFLLADQLLDHDHYGAATVVLSSASSKTAYAAAFELRGTGPRLVGLTAPDHVAFTESLGCYDEVLPYDRIADLPGTGAVAYLDLSGRPELRTALTERLGPRLVLDLAVGLTGQESTLDQAGAMFFAPDRMRRRTLDWGRDGLDQRFAAAWHRFVDRVRPLVDVTISTGPTALRDGWTALLAGRTPPRAGLVFRVADPS